MIGSFEISFSDCNGGSPIETTEEQSPGNVEEQEVPSGHEEHCRPAE